ncbi:FAD-dependent oxidoreductase [Synechococcus sp. J7-Johnson]|uniref:NAD(P)/FAD-dependent oxidoreductase n=1 Tax=Synechococcus sp. J7-Johnson TaxID=2823737 RepID=UPI0020CC9BE6|nr:FAD-dependent oxidoreductase [Synechococcus sp. J7-Johnson]MCP9840879.1 FAD-dependent oxidoreductase [Synechococcus sp. J7-Johnson]
MEEPSRSQANPSQQAPGSTRPVLIAGGGFGGLYTALALASHRHHPPILLVEPQERFLFLPLLYELLSEELRGWEVAPRYDTLLASRGVAWLRDGISRIDASASCVITEQGRTLPYSRLVIATGSRGTSYGIPGVEELAIPFRSMADVERLQDLVQHLLGHPRPLQRLALVGAGPSGVELACKLADLLRGSTVIELIEQGADLLPQARAFNREQARSALLRRDIRLRTHTKVLALEPGRLELSLTAAEEGNSRETLLVDGVIWTAGVTVAPPPIEPAANLDDRGRLLCEPTLELQNNPGVFAIGDVAHVADADGAPLAATAQVAFQQADCLAENLLRSIEGEPLQPFLWKDLGEMISLGIGEASLTGLGLTLAGPAAYRIRQLTYLSRLPGLPHQLRVAAGWLSDLGRPLIAPR